MAFSARKLNGQVALEDQGVCYFLDEWQEHFQQADYNRFTREHSSALNQHRKFRADVWIASPFLSQLAKPYREIGQEFYTIRNSGYTVNGYGALSIRMPTKFFWNAFRRPPTSERDKPMVGGFFGLDVDGLHGCFDTAAGVGVSGGQADVGIKRRGHHWAWAVAAVVVALLVFKYAIGGASGVVTWFFRPSRLGVNMAQPAKPVVHQPLAQPAGPPPVRLPDFMLPPVPVKSKPKVAIEWVSRVGDWMEFGLTDGTVLENPPGTWTGKLLIQPDGTTYVYDARKQSGPVIVPGAAGATR